MTVPYVPADDQPHTLDADLGYNSRGELAQTLEVEIRCADCGASMTLDIACAIPTESIVIDMAQGQAAAHAAALRALVDQYRVALPTGAAGALTELANSWDQP